MMKQRIDNASGFTLIEVLIAAIIIVFGLLAMGTFLGSLVNKNASNERKTMATSIAQQKIEDLRTESLTNDLSSADDNSVGEAIDKSGGKIGASPHASPQPGEIYTLTWSIDETDPNTPDVITVSVNWGDSTASSIVTMQTYINN